VTIWCKPRHSAARGFRFGNRHNDQFHFGKNESREQFCGLSARLTHGSGARCLRDIRIVARDRFFSYGQDKWQPTTKLTLDVGLRWELYFPPTPQHSAVIPITIPPAHRARGIGGNPLNLGVTLSSILCSPLRLGLSLHRQIFLRGGSASVTSHFPNNRYALELPVRQPMAPTQTTAYRCRSGPAPDASIFWISGHQPRRHCRVNGIIWAYAKVPPVPGVACIGLNSNTTWLTRTFSSRTSNPGISLWNARAQEFVLDRRLRGQSRRAHPEWTMI